MSPNHGRRAIVAALMDAISDRNYEVQCELLADDLVLETPFAPPGAPEAVNSRAEYLDAMRGADRAFNRKVMVLDGCDELAGQDALVAQYHADAETRAGRPFPQRYVGFFWFADGKVTRWREFYNPLVIQQAFSPQ